VFAKNAAFILISLVKIIFIVLHKPLIWFGWAWMLEMIFNAAGLIYVYWKRRGHIRKWTFDRSLIKHFLVDSLPLYIALISSYTYMKVDQIMISKMLNDTETGFFSASAKVYDLCFFIVIVLAPSFYPSLIHIYEKDKNLFYKRYAQVTQLFTLLGYAAVISVLLLAPIIIHEIYGQEYSTAINVLRVQILGMLFMFNGGMRSSFMAITKSVRIIMITTSVTAVLNIALNFVLIPKIGIIGSSMATVFTHMVSLFLSNYFFTKSRPIFFIQLNSFWGKYIFQHKHY
jgi:PST family polysaccharide transporter